MTKIDVCPRCGKAINQDYGICIMAEEQEYGNDFVMPVVVLTLLGEYILSDTIEHGVRATAPEKNDGKVTLAYINVTIYCYCGIEYVYPVKIADETFGGAVNNAIKEWNKRFYKEV